MIEVRRSLGTAVRGGGLNLNLELITSNFVHFPEKITFMKRSIIFFWLQFSPQTFRSKAKELHRVISYCKNNNVDTKVYKMTLQV